MAWELVAYSIVVECHLSPLPDGRQLGRSPHSDGDIDLKSPRSAGFFISDLGILLCIAEKVRGDVIDNCGSFWAQFPEEWVGYYG